MVMLNFNTPDTIDEENKVCVCEIKCWWKIFIEVHKSMTTLEYTECFVISLIDYFLIITDQTLFISLYSITAAALPEKSIHQSIQSEE